MRFLAFFMITFVCARNSPNAFQSFLDVVNNVNFQEENLSLVFIYLRMQNSRDDLVINIKPSKVIGTML